MHWRSEIRRMIQGHLKLVARRKIVLRRANIDLLYPNLHQNILRLTEICMSGKTVEVGLVEGSQAVDRLLRLAGNKVAPQQCRPGTLRHTFGVRQPVVFRNTRYYRNALHRAGSLQEVRTQARLLMGLRLDHM